MESRKTSQALRRAVQKYQAEKVEDIRVHVPKGQKDVIRNHAATMGESMNAFAIRAMNETMERDKTQ